MTKTLKIEYDEALLENLNLSEEEFSREAKFWIASKLYELRRISSGDAAELCGMARADFLVALSKAGINASNLQEDALDDETPLA
jgi:predicted HTH domain antitoxin